MLIKILKTFFYKGMGHQHPRDAGRPGRNIHGRPGGGGLGARRTGGRGGTAAQEGQARTSTCSTIQPKHSSGKYFSK